MSDTRHISWEEVLKNRPPGEYRNVSGAVGTKDNKPALKQPILEMYCDSEICGGVRIFESWLNYNSYSDVYVSTFGSGYSSIDSFIKYTCRHCRSSTKTFAASVTLNATENEKDANEQKLVTVTKFGEWPPFGPPTPSRVFELIGTEQDLFLKGRRAEFQGLGIGAFSYYRRIVENQKGRLLDKIAAVAEKTKASQIVVETLRDAKNETQFKRAIDKTKEVFPESLKISGHNPLLLLHKALSEGLHAKTDEECLEAAQDVRLILFEMSNSINQALQDKKELDQAVTRLMNKNSVK